MYIYMRNPRKRKREKEKVRRRAEPSILPGNNVRSVWLSRGCESYLAVREEETDALHADLQEPALARSHILHREFTAELVAHVRASPARRRLLHRVLNAVVHVLTLEETVVHLAPKASLESTSFPPEHGG